MGKIYSAVVFAAFASVSAGCTKTPTNFTDGGTDVVAEVGKLYQYKFDEAPNSTPADFINVLGDWSITAEHALRQSGSFGSGDFPRIVLKSLSFKDFKLSVRCRPEAGSGDQACGAMFRLKDSDNYFITRANALEGNVRLYRVVSGDRQQFATADATVTGNTWHTLGVTAKNANITITWDGVDVITATDATFEHGKVGLWTKADSVTSFDDLEVTAQ